MIGDGGQAGSPRGRVARTTLAAAACGAAAALAGGAWSAAGAEEPGPAITVAAESHPSADLFPGGLGAAQFTVDNPGPVAVHLLSVSFGGVSSSDPARCAAANLTPVRQTLPLSVRVPEGANGVAQSVPGAFRLDSDAPDGCQGVVFTAEVTVTGVAEGGAELPDTGVDAVAAVAGALLLVAGGTALARLGRDARPRG